VTAIPAFLQDDVGRRAVVVDIDVRDRAAVLALGERQGITGIVHLGGALSASPFDEMRDAMTGLANILEAASVWKVKRVCVASAIGVYGAAEDSAPAREDSVIPLNGAPHPIIAMKKATEVYVESVCSRAGIDSVVMRISAIYGPRYRALRSFVSRVAHAAASGTTLDLAGVPWGTGPDDGADWCYVTDCAQAIALLQRAPRLSHRTYNVGSGVATRNRELVDAARRHVRDAKLEPMAPSASPPSVRALDITRLHDDTGYTPRWGVADGMADYIDWLRAGNEA
jgi:UDP-glucose 4-epimerase